MPPGIQVPGYLRRVARKLAEEAEQIGTDYLHHGAVGGNREGKVIEFLQGHLPAAFKVSRGFLVSPDHEMSPETDIVIADALWSAPIHSESRDPIWPVESVYAAIEVKSNLSGEIDDCLRKCRRFKTLRRDWTNTRVDPMYRNLLHDSLFVIWAFDSPTTQTVIDNLELRFREIPNLERPDLTVVNNRFCAYAGCYQILLECRNFPDGFSNKLQAHESVEIPGRPSIVTLDSGEMAIAVFLFWLTQWLQQVGPRSANFMNYMHGVNFGTVLFPSDFRAPAQTLDNPTSEPGTPVEREP
jgi:hypothetical protein